LFHSALQEFFTPPATCAESSKVIVDGAIEKNLCYVKSSLTGCNAKPHCEKNGMQLYRPKSSPQAWEALVAFANKTLGNNKLTNVFVDGRSGDICQALQGNGELKNISCYSSSFFICEFMEAPSIISCSGYEPMRQDWNFFNLSSLYCDYTGPISNGNTVMTVNATIAKESISIVYASENPAIKHLPINLASNFPKLQGITYLSCAISELSYLNLKGLTSLKVLWLDYNRISKLDGEVFKDLVNLRRLSLGETSLFYCFQSDFISLLNCSWKFDHNNQFWFLQNHSPYLG
jgi:hypothetical protein